MGLVNVREVRNQPASLSYRANALYSRVVKMQLEASTIAGTYDITGLELPPGSFVVGAVLNTDTSLGAATLALKTTTAGITFVAAKVLTVVNGESCVIADNLALATLIDAVADDQVQLVIATASTPASVVELEITLILCQAGEADEFVTSNDT